MTVKAIPEGIHTITPHIVVREAGRAAEWYKQTFGAVERGRIPVPGGKFMQIELWFGDSAVMLADEFPEAGIMAARSRCRCRGPSAAARAVLGRSLWANQGSVWLQVGTGAARSRRTRRGGQSGRGENVWRLMCVLYLMS